MSRSLCKTTIRVFLRVRLFTADQQLKLVRRARIVKVAYPHLQRLFWLWLLRHDGFEGATWIESSSAAGTVSGLQKILELPNPSGCQPPFQVVKLQPCHLKKATWKWKYLVQYCTVVLWDWSRTEPEWSHRRQRGCPPLTSPHLPWCAVSLMGNPTCLGGLQQCKLTLRNGENCYLFMLLCFARQGSQRRWAHQSNLVEVKTNLILVHHPCHQLHNFDITHLDLCSCFLLQ